MRKIPSRLENPLDDVLIRGADALLPFLKATGHTPNVITTYSFAASLMALYALHTGHPGAFAVLWMLQYFFDCTDGHFARAYGMVSRFGDSYDHVTDYLAFGGLWAVAFDRYDLKKVNPLFLVGFVTVSALSLMHIGCQQKYYANAAESLDAAKVMCPNTSWMWWTRWFGSGTMHLSMVLFVLYCEKHYLKDSKK